MNGVAPVRIETESRIRFALELVRRKDFLGCSKQLLFLYPRIV